MNIAFHFDASAKKYNGYYGIPIKRLFFKILLETKIEQTHIKIYYGDLLVQFYDPKIIVPRILTVNGVWKDLKSIEDFSYIATNGCIFVLYVEGITTTLRDHLNLLLKKEDAYLGAIEIYEAERIHWVFYKEKLLLGYRYLNGNLRVLYNDIDGEKDQGLFNEWKKYPFKTLEWEKIGVKHSIFDKFGTYEHAKRYAELGEMLKGHLTHIADDILLRLNDLDPKLEDTLYSALKSFRNIETTEDIAHVALSCRRFFEGLADVLFPPRKCLINKRKVGKQEYKNRLWAYISENLNDISRVNDLGNRVDLIIEKVNKGLHSEIIATESHRLIIELLLLTYDLLWLAPPPKEYSRQINNEILDELLRGI